VSVSCGAASVGRAVSSFGIVGASVGGVSARHAKRKSEETVSKIFIFIDKPFLLPIMGFL
jgi:hypothetical protein